MSDVGFGKTVSREPVDDGFRNRVSLKGAMICLGTIRLFSDVWGGEVIARWGRTN